VENKDWALVQPYFFVHEDDKIDIRLGRPYVNLEQCFKVLPCELLTQVVFAVPDHTSLQQAFWIEWFLSFGSHTYPEDHRWRKQQA
jgi:hypothetical protein